MRRAAAVTAAALAALAALSAAGSPASPARSLYQINPWISACDLQQVTVSAPDPHPSHAKLCWEKLRDGERREDRWKNTPFPHCSERNLLSAVDDKGRSVIANGEKDRKNCSDLVDHLYVVDGLAARASKDLDTILQRYDCDQKFSVQNKCPDCKEAYRKWVCGSLLPYYVSESIVSRMSRGGGETFAGAGAGAGVGVGTGTGTPQVPSQRPPPSPPPPPSHQQERRRRVLRQSYELYASNNKNTKLKVISDDYDSLIASSDVVVYSNDSKYFYNNNGAVRYNGSGGMQDRRPLDNRLGRKRREHSTKTILSNTNTKTNDYLLRIKPCLSQCQKVEQACPYFLPADRAPTYPTQYAGEPTFLCLDPNIEETGEQLQKSNYGDHTCCYSYIENKDTLKRIHDKYRGDKLEKELLPIHCRGGTEALKLEQKEADQCAITAQTPQSTCAALAISGSGSGSKSYNRSWSLILVLLALIFNIVYNNIVFWDTRQDAWTILDAVFNYCITEILPCTRL